LGELGELIEPQSKSREEFIEECKSGKLDGILVTFRTFDSIDISGLFDEELVQVLPESLKFVCHNGKLSTLITDLRCCPRELDLATKVILHWNICTRSDSLRRSRI
jgi:hypothetical protein